MNNQRECYEALLAGETLICAENNDKIKLKDGFQVQFDGKKIDYAFSCPKDWSIYKEPKWYENIPDGGVLCWVKDSEEKEYNRYAEIVINYCDDSTHFFETLHESYMHAKPLTKQEIQVFMENAPE